MNTHQDPAEVGAISREVYVFLRREVERQAAELDELRRLAAYWQHQTNYWYMRANYTDAEIAEFHRRLSMGLDENGQWKWPAPDDQ